ncbi:helix-turn-helix transcriptional regulator [Halostreptopolyspora alba]|uniref:Helix-turn-helix transcriptional regulator n=1 Tax=Halostreptopolyspora alba TaxID=2487137 RepID=A0A3N0EI19_9ACTN|nr:helix-turn-helix transcriptional regulator [Nocardiopsaceae bacterium YIM 96095]
MAGVKHGVHRILTPVVLRGRSQEQSRIARALSGMESGQATALLLLGTPGIGKTALLADTRDATTEYTRLTAYGVSSESELAYSGLQQLLLPVTDQVKELPGHHEALLRQMLDTGRIAETDRFALSMAVLELLTALARTTPVLALVDDAHLLDSQSLEVLSFVARRLRDQPLVLLCAARDSQPKPVLPGIATLQMSPLSDSAMGELITDAAPLAPSDTVRAELLRSARGNPHAALALLDGLTDEQLSGQEPLPHPLPLGKELRDAYLERVRDLPESTLHLLLLAAADPDLSIDTLVLAHDHSSGSAAALEPAEERGLVRVHHGRIVFTDPLLRDALYEDMPLYRRRAAHALLAETLGTHSDPARQAWHRAAAAQGPDPQLAAELAVHAETVRESYGYEASSTTLERAADLTSLPRLKGCRLSSAAHHAWLAGQPHRAQNLLDRNRPYATRGRSRGVVDLIGGNIALRSENALDAYNALREAVETLAHRDRPLALRAIVRSAEAASLAGDIRRYGYAEQRARRLCADDDPPEMRLGLTYLMGAAAMFRGDYAAAVTPLRETVSLSARVSSTPELIWATIAALHLGDEPQAHTLATRAVELARERGAVSIIPQAMEFLVYSEFWTGRYPSALSHSLSALRIARETGQPNVATHHTAALALLSAIQGDAHTCQLRARAVADQSAENSLGLPATLSTWALAFLDLSTGDAAQAAHRLRALARAGPGKHHPAVRVLAIPHFVEATILDDQPERAHAPLADYERWANATGSPSSLALLARCRALLESGERAREYFDEALRLHRTGGHLGIEYARTELLYGTTLRRQRSPGPAREHLHCALDIFEHFDARLLAARVRSELRATGNSVRTEHPNRADALTAQQYQIAQLVADGATNREVAAQLYVSPRTVEHHLRNVFRRLNVRSRVEMARMISQSSDSP